MRSASIIAACIACAGLLSACNEQPANGQTPGTALTQCPEQRPQICTYEYQPVCGLRDTGIRCVTTPCPSAEWKTYGNACSACGDTKVSGYVPGECPPEN
ncbi:MAG: hypothetical protein ACPHER_02670 [Nevskiales bacterium]